MTYAGQVQGEVVGGSIVAPERVSGESVASLLFFAGFDGTLSGLSLFDGGGTATTTLTNSEMNTTVDGGWDGGGAGGAANGSFWYNAFQGQLRHVLVTGNFDMIGTVRVRNLADSGLPTVGDGNYRIAGIAAHDPDRSVDLDYVHVGLGCTASAGVECEWKNTTASVSAFGSVAAATGRGQIRLLRVGQIFTAFYRATREAAWTTVQAMDRTAAPLPQTLQCGVMPPYASVVAHDLRLFVDDLTIIRV